MVLAASAAVGEDGPMSLLRRVVRPMLAAPFIIDGLDAVLHPSRHVEKLERVLPTLEKAGAPPVLTSDAVMLTRATGAVSVAAGIGLATGAAPRSSAVVLAALNLPLTLVNNPVWAIEDAARAEAVSGLARAGAVGAGLLLAAVDRGGRPSLGWRIRNSRRQREAMAAAYSSAAARG